jgi:hypothetical protein
MEIRLADHGRGISGMLLRIAERNDFYHPVSVLRWRLKFPGILNAGEATALVGLIHRDGGDKGDGSTRFACSVISGLPRRNLSVDVDLQELHAATGSSRFTMVMRAA